MPGTVEVAGVVVGFGEPWLLPALGLPVLAAIVLWVAVGRRRRAVAAWGGAFARGYASRREAARAVLVVLALLAAVLAAARPLIGTGEQPLEQRGIDLVIALDVSRSMEADDLAPSRAEAASDGIAALLTHMTGNRVGLVTFGASAFERSPLTTDLGVVADLAARAQAEAPLVQPGTGLVAAIQASLQALEADEPASTRAILLVTDGEHDDQSLDAILADAREAGVTIYGVFAATEAPTMLPGEGGGDVTTGRPDVLDAIAAATGGETRDVATMPGLAVEFRRLQQTQFATETQPAPVDRFAWFAGAAVVLLGLAALLGEWFPRPSLRLRDGVVTASFLVALLLAGCGTAAWQAVEHGNEAYAMGDYEGALAAYREAAASLGIEDPEAASDLPVSLEAVRVDLNLAAALYQLERYDEAAVVAERARVNALAIEDGDLAAAGWYALGNVEYQRAQLEAARDAYVAALRLDPDAPDAKANLELVLRLLTPPGSEGDPGDGGDNGSGEDGTQEQSKPNPGDAGAEDAPGGEGDSSPGDAGGATQGDQSGTGQGGEPGQPDSSAGTGDVQGDQVPVAPSTGSGGSTPSASSEARTLEEAQAQLQAALADLGEEVTAAEAQAILELARRANELDRLPPSGGGVPPR